MTEGAEALTVLMREAIDYAGLFPPAARNMADSVGRYARYRLGPDAFALGRFVVPAVRLAEWEQAVAALPPADRGTDPWRLTALVSLPASPDMARDLTIVADFNRRAAAGSDVQACVDSIEVKATTPDEVRRVAAEVPRGLGVFYECAPGESLPAILDEAAAVGGGAKIRTGGLVPSAIAAPEAVAGFIAACAVRALPFKATAGLHHAIRATHSLTYEPDSPRAVMHGFLNLFVAAVLADVRGLDAAGLLPIIEDTSPGAFTITGAHVGWRHMSAGLEQIAAARQLARGFGSCSFEEPIADLRALGVHL